MATIPHEVTAMHGCDCAHGWLDYHEVGCSGFQLTQEQYNIEADAARRLNAYINLFNGGTRAQP